MSRIYWLAIASRNRSANMDITLSVDACLRGAPWPGLAHCLPCEAHATRNHPLTRDLRACKAKHNRTGRVWIRILRGRFTRWVVKLHDRRELGLPGMRDHVVKSETVFSQRAITALKWSKWLTRHFSWQFHKFIDSSLFPLDYTYEFIQAKTAGKKQDKSDFPYLIR